MGPKGKVKSKREGKRCFNCGSPSCVARELFYPKERGKERKEKGKDSKEHAALVETRHVSARNRKESEAGKEKASAKDKC